MGSDLEKIRKERTDASLAFSLPWITGLALYVVGLLLSYTTGNLTNFILDYPWACLLAVVMIAIWLVPKLVERHRLFTIRIRPIFDVSDQKFEALLESKMRRLTSLKNILLGLFFFPDFSGASRNVFGGATTIKHYSLTLTTS